MSGLHPSNTPNSSQLTQQMGMRDKVKLFLENTIVQKVIVALIIVNAVLLGAETSTKIMDIAGNPIRWIDRCILGIFVVEIVLRLWVYRLSFWKDPWSLFDFTVVTIALIPSTGSLAVLRAFRVLRVLRLLTTVPSMRRVVGALLAAVPGLSSIALVLFCIYYVFGVIATNLFSETFPQWFGSLDATFYTLFQIMTLESWSMGIARPVMEVHPYAWAFFIPFIMIATFTILNLFIAIIVNAMQTFSETEHAEMVQAVDDARTHIEDDLHSEVKLLRSEIQELKALLIQQNNS